jgi:hypothetical protein
MGIPVGSDIEFADEVTMWKADGRPAGDVDHYRALTITWVWIGTHEEYNRLVRGE